MASIAELAVRISADVAQFQKAMGSVGSGLTAAGAGLSRFSQRLESARVSSEALTRAATRVGAVAGAALGALGIAAIKASSDMEQSRIAFTTLLGDAQKAQTFLDDLAQFAARTPFELKGLQDSSKKLLAFGFGAEQIIPMMRDVGDAVAGLGGGGEMIDRVTRALGQMQAKGKVSAEEMMQIAETGIPAWQFLADAAGKTVAEVMDLSQKGAIDASFAIPAILAGMRKKFGGMMEKQSDTIGGAWSNMLDGMYQATVAIGDRIAEAFPIKKALQQAGQALTDFAALVKRVGVREALDRLIPPHVEAAIYAVAGAITLAMIPALYSMATAAWAAIVPLAPLLAAGAALGALAYVVFKNWRPVADFFKFLWETIAANVRVGYFSIEVILQEMQLGLAAALDFMLGGVSRFVRALAEKFTWLEKVPGLGGLIKGIRAGADAVAGAMEDFKTKAAENLDWAKGEFADAISDQAHAWEHLKAAAVEAGTGIAATVKDVFTSAEGLLDMGKAAETAAKGTEAAAKATEQLNRAVDNAKSRETSITNAKLVAIRQLWEGHMARGELRQAGAALAAMDLVKGVSPGVVSSPTSALAQPLAAAGATGGTQRIDHSGTIRVEGVSSRGELIGVTEIVGEHLGREIQRDQDRFGTGGSGRRVFR